jgi:hypothetical protein
MLAYNVRYLKEPTQKSKKKTEERSETR